MRSRTDSEGASVERPEGREHGGWLRRYPCAVNTLKVALLGCGVVGSEVARVLTKDAAELANRVGAPLELVGIAVRDLERHRTGDLPTELFTTDARALVARGDLDIVIEVIGGIEPARELILSALEHGASVVTANKALLALDAATLYDAASKADRDLAFEAAVAGAIPIVRPLRESLAGDAVKRVLGIVNGTTNFILDAMTPSGTTPGMSFESALAEMTLPWTVRAISITSMLGARAQPIEPNRKVRLARI